MGSSGGSHPRRVWEIFGGGGSGCNSSGEATCRSKRVANETRYNYDVSRLEEIAALSAFEEKLQIDDGPNLHLWRRQEIGGNDSAISVDGSTTTSDGDGDGDEEEEAIKDTAEATTFRKGEREHVGPGNVPVAIKNNEKKSQRIKDNKQQEKNESVKKKGKSSLSAAARGNAEEEEVKYLERHLSMKKTIRKKIMRDLRKAFVEDPNEFKVEDIPPERLKADINARSLSFARKGGRRQTANAAATTSTSPSNNFLDFLRGGNAVSSSSTLGLTVEDHQPVAASPPIRHTSGCVTVTTSCCQRKCPHRPESDCQRGGPVHLRKVRHDSGHSSLSSSTSSVHCWDNGEEDGKNGVNQSDKPEQQSVVSTGSATGTAAESCKKTSFWRRLTGGKRSGGCNGGGGERENNNKFI